ncbi:ornithine cyclodeaminase family protein [Pontibaca salina]|uniref:Ornithine cyclodeaminase n=1 Tax=Pontibaca salina TaxID=2795731 RepID=A0A934M017_9RHOB|nr:ornithine cyclodeaminase [Pontibaca salina]MBI6629560.1 ornithine cyclodeaminase [Pontibaca salina]
MTRSPSPAPRLITRGSLGSAINWPHFVAALKRGHQRARAQISDVVLGPPEHSLLSRAAWIDGLGSGVKSVTVTQGNPGRGLPSVQGAMLVFDPLTGALEAIIDSALLTDLKTAADSLLGAQYLARADSKTLLVIGAGSVARTAISAYCAVFPHITQALIWSRTASKAKALAEELTVPNVALSATENLREALGSADIVTTATMSHEPVLLGDWVRPGTHVDLVGAFRAEMREADDALLQKARLFVDNRDTTLNHIGELMIPLASGAIALSDVLGDLYDLEAGIPGRTAPEDVTVFKNGGGAHLDLMTARAILDLL